MARLAPPLLLLALLASPGCGEDPVPALQARKAELLETTVAKEEFWAQVERKGIATKQVRDLEKELEKLRGEEQQLHARLVALDEAVGRAREVNERAATVVADVDARLVAVEGERAELEATLVGWGVEPPEPEPAETEAGPGDGSTAAGEPGS